MRERFDLLVIGAGPGGLVAAATAAEAGMRVCLVDDNPAPGGQIWRAGISENRVGGESAAWVNRLGRVEKRFGWQAVLAPAPRVLRIEQPGQFADIEYSSLILATGARERFLPFPGWTLPGVYGAGGLQAFAKSGFDVRGKRIVVAGTGPLLLAVAAHLRAAGARIVFIAEQAPLRPLARFSLGLMGGQIGKLVEGAGYSWATAGVPYRTGSWVTSAFGTERLTKVAIRTGARTMEIETDLLAIGYHLVPNTELAQLLHCELEGGYVRVDAMQQTSEKGIYCCGELTGIGGLDKARVEGHIAALAASGQADRARALVRERDQHLRFARNLASAFALRDELRTLPAENTVVCRCEDVLYGELASCRSWREAKLHTRCGMGPCQGRICGSAVDVLFGWKPSVPRPPLFSADVATLGEALEPTEVSLKAEN